VARPFAAEGEAGLVDRSSRPHRSPTRLGTRAEEEVEALRRRRLTGPAVARRLGRPVSTVGRVLRRRGLGRLAALDPREPAVRYERERPGELVHMDIKKPGRIDGVGRRITGDRGGRSSRRGTGWEYLHVAVDDRSRLAYTELLPGEGQDDASGFLGRAVAWFAGRGVAVERATTDNGSAYDSRRFSAERERHGVRHKRTRPYTPRTNGKAERFIQTSLREWACLRPFGTSAERAAAMRPWLHGYNTVRPHAALGGKPPVSRLPGDNLLGNDS
jgi:transposase InsO family protein